IRAVKTWYQAGSAWNDITFDQSAKNLVYKLVPELLVHDTSLVKVDYQKKRNYLKLNTENGIKYVNISGSQLPEYDGMHRKGSFYDIPVSEFPVADDADSLQPFTVKNNHNQQFWLTIDLPDDTKPGIYKAKL